jgi:hypothetical protein
MREARNGLSRETRSLNGSGRRARCFGFTVNVRVSFPLHFRIYNGALFYSGVRKEYYFVRTIPFLPFRVEILMTDIFD